MVISLQGELPMDRVAVLQAEVQILGTLCNQAGTSEQRAELIQTLHQYTFLDSEHQILFESIRSLLPRDRLSNVRLAVHLNNRGFPDVDLEKYCAAWNMIVKTPSQRGFGMVCVVFALACVAVAVIVVLFAPPCDDTSGNRSCRA